MSTRFPNGLQANLVGNVTGNVTGGITGDVTGDLTGGVQLPVQDLDDDGAIALTSGVVVISKATAAAITLAAPGAGDDGKILHVVDVDGSAHVVTHVAGYNGGANDLATFGGAAGDAMTLVAFGEAWYTLNLRSVTLSEDQG
jgi:hypothetical protein